MGSKVSRSTSRTSVVVPLAYPENDVRLVIMKHSRQDRLNSSDLTGQQVVRTSLRDLGECQTSTSLQIDVIREDQCAQSS